MVSFNVWRFFQSSYILLHYKQEFVGKLHQQLATQDNIISSQFPIKLLLVYQ